MFTAGEKTQLENILSVYAKNVKGACVCVSVGGVNVQQGCGDTDLLKEKKREKNKKEKRKRFLPVECLRCVPGCIILGVTTVSYHQENEEVKKDFTELYLQIFTD